MFTRHDGPKALVTVIRMLAGGVIPTDLSERSVSLIGAVNALMQSGRSKIELILEVLDDYEAIQPQIVRATRVPPTDVVV